MTLATFTGHTSSCQRLRKAVQSYKKKSYCAMFQALFPVFFLCLWYFFLFFFDYSSE